jgi:hypothetical protein
MESAYSQQQWKRTRNRARRKAPKMRLQRWLVLVAVSLVTLGALATSAQAAVTVTRAELNGTQLRVEGNGALPNHAVSINPGPVTGTSDANGAFRIETSPYSSQSCNVTVSDGVTSTSVTLSGCTPSSPPPPPPPPGPAPIASISPTTLTYASQNTGSTSAAQTVTASNTGNASLSITGAALGGANAADYLKAIDSCSGVTLAAGSSCSVSVAFRPTAGGTRTATLAFTDNASNSPQIVSISGTGATPPPPPPPPPPASGPAVTFTPTSLTFGAQAIGTTSAAQSVTVANTGNAPLFINSAATRGANPLDFTEVNDGCSGLTLAAGTSCSVSINFSPTASGTRSGTLIVTDNAPGSPQTVPITGTGTGTNPALAIDTRFMTCTGGVCDVGANRNVFVNNFFSTSFLASGGTPPYTWSGRPPTGLTLRPSGLVLGSPAATGTSTFTITVTDAAGATATGTFSLTVTGPPAPTPPGCQTGGTLTEALSGPAFNGRTPSGEATSDESQFSGCGGFSILSVQVNNVNLPDGTQIWVTLDFGPVGTITLRGGSGAMTPYNMGRSGVTRDQIRVNSALPDVSTAQQILIGGSFVN